ncbi:MAG: bifunctional methylenetetrahydrofolate dehydrogenase/methenyltetrahydrofolate cyclohydrolase FolD [Desulfobulbaceae bacterium]|nr:bifunctional methylenetetrahydrofolate dehydrogenase/methenyltetrahydrofolate cyclohydrolase FolD [Candidatus Kapabacteria bacterium]MBS4001633.1 bifunctional methylenetetrahydrofolate dehydrogenase/methenyltetrahydrofolate cyclohydrolase FolD [Desulfobulbaceae bacterium]
MEKIIDGKIISQNIREEIFSKASAFKASTGIIPGLALMIVGNDPASEVYVGMKAKTCEKLGFYSLIERLPETTSQEQVLAMIDEWNNRPDIHGILVQMPLPKHVSDMEVIKRINPDKDVDGFHPVNVGKLVAGIPCLQACTPAGIMELLKRSNVSLKGKHAVVLGRSNIVGKPIANLLYQKNKDANAIVTICHTAAPDIAYYTRQADVLIAAAGAAEIIKRDMIKEGVVIIDVGTNRVEAPDTEKGYRLTGDVDFNDVYDKVSLITPVPGGVGPMTITMLMYNTLEAAIMQSR